MSVAEIVAGEWIALVDDEIVGRGKTLEEAVADAEEGGHSADDLLVQMAAAEGTYIL